MNIDINTPEISVLLRDVENKCTVTPRLAIDFTLIADKLEKHGERLSQSTLERLWQYSTRRKSTVSRHTLDVLARFVGASDWEAYRTQILRHVHPESEYFTEGIIDTGELPNGCLIEVTWLPDRRMTVRYQGHRRFEVVSSLNTHLQPGDSFEITQLQQGQPLYLDRYQRVGAPAAESGEKPGHSRYVIGRDTGVNLSYNL